MKQDVHRSPEPIPVTGRVKKRKSRFHMVMALFLSIVAVSIALVVMIIVNLNFKQNGAAETAESKSAVFGVKSVTVEGETRYSKEAIVGISGIRVGQSIFSVNKRSAAEKVKAAFPYLDTVEISSASFDDIRIKITETEPIGAIYAGGSWIVVGRDGRGLEALPEEVWMCYTMPRFEEPGFLPLDKAIYDVCFSSMDALIFVGACGIAVREIAPYVKSKKTDPAVVCIDEAGQFVIPLLSGHIGGANALAEKLAEKLDATAVVTTATDVRGKFAVDAWAARHGCAISDMGLAKAVSAAILEGDVPLCSQFYLPVPLPEGTFAGETGPLGIFIGWHVRTPFARTLRLIPRVLRVGVGCRRGISAEAVVRAVQTVFAENGLDTAAIRGVCSIDLKQDEPGLLAACEKNNWPVHFYTAQQLRDVAGDFTPSDFVCSVTGVDNVCERAALLDAEKLIVQKTARDGVTVAVAAEHWEVRFG